MEARTSIFWHLLGVKSSHVVYSFATLYYQLMCNTNVWLNVIVARYSTNSLEIEMYVTPRILQHMKEQSPFSTLHEHKEYRHMRDAW